MNNMQLLNASSFAEAMEIANVVSKSGLIPDTLRDKPHEVLVAMHMAQRWRLDPIGVMQSMVLVHGKICYEGKLCHAVLLASKAIREPLQYEYRGEGEMRCIKVTGLLPNGRQESVSGTVRDWATRFPKSSPRAGQIMDHWRATPDKMLAYRGAREWGRLYAPHIMLGFMSDDDVVSAVEMKAADGEVIETVAEEESTGEIEYSTTRIEDVGKPRKSGGQTYYLYSGSDQHMYACCDETVREEMNAAFKEQTDVVIGYSTITGKSGEYRLVSEISPKADEE